MEFQYKSGDEVWSPPSHQRARSNDPAVASDRLASMARAGGIHVAVAPVDVEAASFSLELVVFAGR